MRSCSATTHPCPHSTFRYAVEPVTLGGVTIPAGAQVIICLAAANRDVDKFASPESLDVDRSVTRHLAFGHGVHHCLGAPLARMEGQVALGLAAADVSRSSTLAVPLGGPALGAR